MSIQFNLLFWLSAPWRVCQEQIKNNRLAHALLITGKNGVGKYSFALHLAQAVNCEKFSEIKEICNECKSCKLFLAGTHPDVRQVSLEDDATQIKIDDVRELCQLFTMSRHYQGYKVGIIKHAHLMNQNASNAILKTLEEPSPWSLLLLTTERPYMLLPTVRSRCFHVKLSTPSRADALSWLNNQNQGNDWESALVENGNAPLAALTAMKEHTLADRVAFFASLQDMIAGRQSALKVAEKLKDTDLAKVVDWLESWCADSIRLQYGREPMSLENIDIRRALHDQQKNVDLELLFRFFSKLLEIRKLIGAPLNKRLVLEDVLLSCASVVR